MDYKYNEAFKRAKELHEAGNALTKQQMEIVFPQLAESEDERIRKLLVWQVHRNIEDETNDLAGSVYDGVKGHDPDLEESIEDWKKCLAWLEKQKINTEGDFGRGYDCGYEACLNSHGAEWFEKQKPTSFYMPYNPDDYEVVMEGNATSLKQKEQKPKPYFYCKYGGTIPLCSECKRNHYNSSFKTEEITTWYTPSNGTKHCIDYIQQEQPIQINTLTWRNSTPLNQRRNER